MVFKNQINGLNDIRASFKPASNPLPPFNILTYLIDNIYNV